jgi:YtkA-like
MSPRPFALVAGLLTALVLVGAAPAAQAHGGDPAISVEAVHSLGDGSFHFIVDMVYADDGDPISGKTVTATPVSPSGATGSAVTLPSTGDGVYQGPVPLPEDGTWTVKIASADPAGAIDYGFVVDGDTGTPAAPATTTPPAPATTVPVATTTAAAPTTTVPVTTATTAADIEDASASASESADTSDSDLPIVLILVGAALLVALAGVPLALRIIRNSTDRGTPPTDEDQGDSTYEDETPSR